MTTLFRRCLTLFMSTLKYTTLFQCWFDVVPRRDVASTKRQRWNNVEMFPVANGEKLLTNFVKLFILDVCGLQTSNLTSSLGTQNHERTKWKLERYLKSNCKSSINYIRILFRTFSDEAMIRVKIVTTKGRHFQISNISLKFVPFKETEFLKQLCFALNAGFGFHTSISLRCVSFRN